MAFASTTEWDVRTTGSDSNGGGFNTASSGTDYSTQDSPQVTFTDLAIDAANNLKCTSALQPFTSAHVGNIINITGGTGFTVQRVQINSVTSGVATCDKSLGTLSSTGGTGALGGGLATIPTANGLLQSGGTIHIKAGTYTITSLVQMADITASVLLMGYQTTHGDYGTKPLITTSTNSTVLLKIRNGNGTSALSYNFANISWSNTAATRADGVDALGGSAPGYFYRCVFDGFAVAVNAPGGAAFEPLLVMDECEVKNCTSYGVRNRAGGAGNLQLTNCYIHNNGDSGVRQEGGGTVTLIGCIVAANGGDGLNQANNNTDTMVYIIEECDFADNTGDGIQFGGAGGGQTGAAYIGVKNCIFWGNGGYGVNCPVAPKFAAAVRNNAYGSNTSGPRLNFPVGVSNVILTADPFVDASTGNYYLNNTLGGGASLRGTGYQWGV